MCHFGSAGPLKTARRWQRLGLSTRSSSSLGSHFRPPASCLPSETDVRVALCDWKLLESSFTQQVGGPSHAASLPEAPSGLALLQMIDDSLAMHQRQTAPQTVQHRGCHRPGSLSRAFSLTPLCQPFKFLLFARIQHSVGIAVTAAPLEGCVYHAHCAVVPVNVHGLHLRVGAS